MEAERELLNLNARAEALMASGEHEAALPIYRRFVERLTALFGAQAEDTLAGVNNLGVLLHRLHANAEAEVVLSRALEGKRRVLKPGDATLADTCKNLADVYRDTGRPALAAPLYREALACSRVDKGASHPATIEIVDDLADCVEASDPVAALALLRESLAAKRKRSGDAAPDTQKTKVRCAHLLRNVLGRSQEASELEALVGDSRPTSTASAVSLLVRAVSGRNLMGGGGGGVLSGSAAPAGAQQDAMWATSPGSSPGSSSGGAGGGGGGVVTNPLALASMATQRAASSRSLGLAAQPLAAPAPLAPAPAARDPAKVYKRFSDQEGTWYVCELTQDSVWVLPPDCFVEEG